METNEAADASNAVAIRIDISEPVQSVNLREWALMVINASVNNP